jgi:hypothetical protein
MITPDAVARHIWQMIDEHVHNNNQPAFENLRHLAQNVSTVTGCSILVAEEVVEAMAADVLCTGLVEKEN